MVQVLGLLSTALEPDLVFAFVAQELLARKAQAWLNQTNMTALWLSWHRKISSFAVRRSCFLKVRHKSIAFSRILALINLSIRFSWAQRVILAPSMIPGCLL